jgi:molecular chaperone IbpA
MLENDHIQLPNEQNYPPYNIERTGDDSYEIAIAAAGFSPEEITVTRDRSVLRVEGFKNDNAEHDYLYQGIHARQFQRQFNLADYVEVVYANYEAGLIRIHLVRELPEAMKPRRIEIGTARKDRRLKAA